MKLVKEYENGDVKSLDFDVFKIFKNEFVYANFSNRFSDDALFELYLYLTDKEKPLEHQTIVDIFPVREIVVSFSEITTQDVIELEYYGDNFEVICDHLENGKILIYEKESTLKKPS